MIKAGIFDVGGVLHKRVSKYIYKDIKKTLNISDKVFHKNWHIVEDKLGRGLVTEEEFWLQFLKKTKSKESLPSESLFLREFIKRYNRNNDVFEIIRRLKAKGHKVAVLSNTVKPHADYQNKIGVYQIFDAVILSNEVGMKKPDPKIYKYLLNILNLKADEVFFVDDDIKNVEAAEKLGMHAILFLSAKQLEKEFVRIGLRI
jgi:epoxide hydrolase-like predicted phosphatase